MSHPAGLADEGRVHLEAVVDRAAYRDTPYTLALKLGEAQLAFRPFDLSVLEFYRNDPRYHYSNDDIGGWIAAHGPDDASSLPEHDQIPH